MRVRNQRITAIAHEIDGWAVVVRHVVSFYKEMTIPIFHFGK